ncbi:putative protein OS=Tsukamurella paurometabola (strain ATCC 8368 / DSM / CCUG 35730 /CIP 100753 / JCM 10117 / KCTC 9821 / NBRC 16120 / NCIMB 702349/ NCTC 13040) OX=521096 GN=Tpau_1440 PE=4 SV=1 [Tsukamurella paurometabola]|uniref:Uncharacterized protein n=1 Tax=Tsukamurella paurometabola (strain ATCC 8368 / DSM 20162 / CCUG 35730 / CIP 100753 / JCM 10117 / KCTC 9821 / NBRC 16120 / NCIMB 702349 / NCTC 13040) TaxID=521096 RepID=D5UXH6_TSUPD|nr:hypothetical protein [Tsukamurella paurometabola]ADG78068.1 hypothetical protein Tpau_1440 [Tsukamurella paurometabola DSM 20162]SUP30027.1 Uncharacterised protein [Tsukamurella paurometabola]
MTWQPLSRRSKGLTPDGPFEGVPAHLKPGLIYWFQGISGYHSNRMAGGHLRRLAVLVRAAIPIRADDYDTMDHLIKRAVEDDDFFLDLVDGALHVWGPQLGRTEALAEVLSAGGSVWQIHIDSGGVGLRRRGLLHG